MSEIVRPVLTGNEAQLKIDDASITLCVFPNARGLPYDILLRAFGTETLLEGFAAVRTNLDENGKVKFGPDVLCVTATGQRPFVAVVGLHKVVFVDVKKQSVLEVLQLNRKPGDDQGFYKLEAVPLTDGFLIIYEGGAARIKEGGEVAWHRPLKWDDIYGGADSKLLYYSSEFGEFAPDDWAISISDGTAFKLKKVKSS